MRARDNNPFRRACAGETDTTKDTTMKQLKITIGDAGGCTAGSFKRTGRASCVQNAGKAQVGDTALVTCKHEWDRTEIGLCRLVEVGPRDEWDEKKGRAQYVWERIEGEEADDGKN